MQSYILLRNLTHVLLLKQNNRIKYKKIHSLKENFEIYFNHIRQCFNEAEKYRNINKSIPVNFVTN